MVDFRVNMVRTTSYNNTSHIIFFNILYCFLALFTHIFSKSLFFSPSSLCSLFNLILWNISKNFSHSVCKYFFRAKSYKRISKIYVVISDFFNIIFNVFWITCYNRTVIVVICTTYFLMFISYTRIEYKLNAVIYKWHNMSMYYFSWVTSWLTRYRLYTHFVNLSATLWTKFYTISQFCKESEPKWEILIHIENSRNTYYTSFSLIFWNRLIIKKSVIFILEKIRYTTIWFFLT